LFVPALSGRGLSCSDITHVVCSHGHSDHVGNLNLFPEALLIVSFDICRGDTYFENGLAKVSVCIFIRYDTIPDAILTCARKPT